MSKITEKLRSEISIRNVSNHKTQNLVKLYLNLYLDISACIKYILYTRVYTKILYQDLDYGDCTLLAHSVLNVMLNKKKP